MIGGGAKSWVDGDESSKAIGAFDIEECGDHCNVGVRESLRKGTLLALGNDCSEYMHRLHVVISIVHVI